MRDPEIGIRIIEIARKFKVIDKIEIAKTAMDGSPLPDIFGKIREFDKNVTLINTIFLKYATNEKEHLELESMRDLNIQGINVKYNFATFELFKLVKENGFKFYVWGVLFNRPMQKILLAISIIFNLLLIICFFFRSALNEIVKDWLKGKKSLPVQRSKKERSKS